MTDIRPPTPEELSAYADGELDPQRQAEVALYLSSNEVHDAQLSADAAILGGLRTMRSKISPDSTPQRLLDAAFPKEALSFIRKRAGILVGTVAALGVLAAMLVFVSRPDMNKHDEEMADRAVAENAEYFLGPDEPSIEFGVTNLEYIKNTLPTLGSPALNAPRMDGTGFIYLGGRTSSIDGAGAVVLFYRDKNGERYGLTIWPDARVNAPTPVILSASETHYWSSNGHRFAITGDNSRDQLKLFEAAYRAQSNE